MSADRADDGYRWRVLGVVMLVAAPLFEELLFRGVVLRAFAALIHALVEHYSRMLDRGEELPRMPQWFVAENKWRSARYGMDATFIDPDTLLAVPAQQVAKRLIERCAPYAERLGCLEQLRYLDDIVDEGTGARRQRRVFEETHDLKDVVRYMIEQCQTVIAH